MVSTDPWPSQIAISDRSMPACRNRTPPPRIGAGALTDLAAPFVAKFLDHLESARSNVARSRNLRLAATRSFVRFAAVEAPQHSTVIQRVLATPSKRTTRRLIDFLDRAEINAVLARPDQTTWIGRRDHALLRLTFAPGTFDVSADMRNERPTIEPSDCFERNV